MPTANKGFCVRRGNEQTWSFVLLFKFIAGWYFSVPKPARTQSPTTLVATKTNKHYIKNGFSEKD